MRETTMSLFNCIGLRVALADHDWRLGWLITLATNRTARENMRHERATNTNRMAMYPFDPRNEYVSRTRVPNREADELTHVVVVRVSEALKTVETIDPTFWRFAKPEKQVAVPSIAWCVNGTSVSLAQGAEFHHFRVEMCSDDNRVLAKFKNSEVIVRKATEFAHTIKA